MRTKHHVYIRNAPWERKIIEEISFISLECLLEDIKRAKGESLASFFPEKKIS